MSIERMRRVRAASAVALVAAVVAVSPAPAAGEEQGGIVPRRDGSKAVQVVTVPDTAARTDPFDWGDAGFGAGAAVVALLLVSAGAHVFRGRLAARRSPLAAAGS